MNILTFYSDQPTWNDRRRKRGTENGAYVSWRYMNPQQHRTNVAVACSLSSRETGLDFAFAENTSYTVTQTDRQTP